MFDAAQPLQIDRIESVFWSYGGLEMKVVVQLLLFLTFILPLTTNPEFMCLKHDVAPG